MPLLVRVAAAAHAISGINKKNKKEEEITYSEKRFGERVKFTESVQFQIMDTEYFGGCLACDISEHGVRINLNDFVPLDTEMQLSLRLAADQVIDCNAKVIWIHKLPYTDRYQAGLVFEAGDEFQESKKVILKKLEEK